MSRRWSQVRHGRNLANYTPTSQDIGPHLMSDFRDEGKLLNILKLLA